MRVAISAWVVYGLAMQILFFSWPMGYHLPAMSPNRIFPKPASLSR